MECTKQVNRTVGCPAGHTGSISQTQLRTLTDYKTGTYEAPAWETTAYSCRQIPIICRTREGGGEEGRKWCGCSQGGRFVSSTSGACGSSGGGSSSGGDNDNGRDHDGDGRTAQDGDTNDHEGPSNGDADAGRDRSNKF
ncbi:hypothetical protein [Kiloniella sp.]|uniref:hypothetical protein n=1 Tax=Kiloniella sp. TaxID=1938587 RepID=UPI003B01C4F4